MNCDRDYITSRQFWVDKITERVNEKYDSKEIPEHLSRSILIAMLEKLDVKMLTLWDNQINEKYN